MDERKALELLGMSKHDIEKHLKDGVFMYSTPEEYIEAYEAGGGDWEEDFMLTKASFCDDWYDLAETSRNFCGDADLLVCDEGRFLIDYCL